MNIYVNQLKKVNRTTTGSSGKTIVIPEWKAKAYKIYAKNEFYNVDNTIYKRIAPGSDTELTIPGTSSSNWEKIPEYDINIEEPYYKKDDIIQTSVDGVAKLAKCNINNFNNKIFNIENPLLTNYEYGKYYEAGEVVYTPVESSSGITQLKKFTRNDTKIDISTDNIPVGASGNAFWNKTEIGYHSVYHDDGKIHGRGKYQTYVNTIDGSEELPSIIETRDIVVYKKLIIINTVYIDNLKVFTPGDTYYTKQGDCRYCIERVQEGTEHGYPLYAYHMYLLTRTSEEKDYDLIAPPASSYWIDNNYIPWEEYNISGVKPLIYPYLGLYDNRIYYNENDKVTYDGYVWNCIQEGYQSEQAIDLYKPHVGSQYWERYAPMYSFEKIGVIDSMASIVWIERYIKEGTFELKVQNTKENYDMLKIGNYITKSDTDCCMIIEKIRSKYDEENGEILIVSGRDLKSILDRRVVFPAETFTGIATQDVGGLALALKYLISDFYIDPSRLSKINTVTGLPMYNFSDRKTDLVSIGEFYGNAMNNANLNKDYINETVLDVVNEICETNNVGYKIILKPGDDKTNPSFEFIGYSGENYSIDRVDLTKPLIMFSKEFGNLKSSDFSIDSTEVKNVAICSKEKDADKYIDLRDFGIKYNEDGSIQEIEGGGWKNTILKMLQKTIDDVIKSDGGGQMLRNIIRAFAQSAASDKVGTIKIEQNEDTKLSFTVRTETSNARVIMLSTDTPQQWWYKFVTSTQYEWLTPAAVSGAFSQTKPGKVFEKLIDDDSLKDTLQMVLNQFSSTSSMVKYLYSTSGSASGIDRREVSVEEEKDNEKWSDSKAAAFIASTDVTVLNDKDDEETDEDIIERLNKSAIKGLAKYSIKNEINAELETESSFVYGKDFELGDIVQINDKNTTNGRMFVSEYTITEDDDGYCEYPTFEKFYEIPRRFTRLKNITLAAFLTDITYNIEKDNETLDYTRYKHELTYYDEEISSERIITINNTSFTPNIMEFDESDTYLYGQLVYYTGNALPMDGTNHYYICHYPVEDPQEYFDDGPEAYFANHFWKCTKYDRTEYRTYSSKSKIASFDVTFNIPFSSPIGDNYVFGVNDNNSKWMWLKNKGSDKVEYSNNYISSNASTSFTNPTETNLINVLNPLTVSINTPFESPYMEGVFLSKTTITQDNNAYSYENSILSGMSNDGILNYTLGIGCYNDNGNIEGSYDASKGVSIGEFKVFTNDVTSGYTITFKDEMILDQDGYYIINTDTSRGHKTISSISDNRQLISDLVPVLDNDANSSNGNIPQTTIYGFYDTVKQKFTKLSEYNPDAIYIDNGGKIDEQ